METKTAYVPGRGLFEVRFTDDPSVVFVKSESVEGRWYRVQGVGTPNASCNCPATRFCKHLAAVMEGENMVQPEVLTAEEADAEQRQVAVMPAHMSQDASAGLVARLDMTQRGELARRQAAALAGGYKETLYLATAMHGAQLVPESIDTPQKAALVMMKAVELGIPPISAFEFLHVINGKIGIQSQMIAALVQRSKVGRIEILETDAEHCKAVGIRQGYRDLTFTFTMAEARRAGLPTGRNKVVWERYPADMLRHKAVARIGRLMFADLLGGMDVSDGGGVVVDYSVVPEAEGEHRHSVDPAPPEPTAAKPQYPWAGAMRDALGEVRDIATIDDVGEYLVAYLDRELDRNTVSAAIDDYLVAHNVQPRDLVKDAINWRDGGRPFPPPRRPVVASASEPEPEPDPEPPVETIPEAEFREEPEPQMDTLFAMPEPIVPPAQPPRHG